MTGDEAGAIADLTAANRIAPSEPIAGLLAELTARAGATGDPAAIETLRARVAASPDDRNARLALAEALARAGKIEDARRELDAYVEADPDAAADLDAAGDVLLEAAPLEAARYYARATNNAPGNLDYRLKLGSALVRAGRHADAVDALEPVLARAADRREAHAGLAASYYGLGRYVEAAREFGWLAEKDPKATAVQFYLGASLDRIGDCRGAIDAFRRFLSAADPVADKTRIDDVNIRLPAIERQLESDGCKKLEKGQVDKKRS
jgi:tetratricopeptide (TPR) repeat protein